MPNDDDVVINWEEQINLPKKEIESTMEIPIDSFYGRNTKQRYRKQMESVQACYPTKCEINNHTLIGIEVEVENIQEKVLCTPIWNYKEDGSLRNNGIEYVSIPMEARYVPSALSYLKQQLEEANTPEYTSRTSIHVHVNVQNMSFKQIQVFTILYLCFESLLYTYVGNNRNRSIFCVPLSHAGYTKKIREFFSYNIHTNTYFTDFFRNWHKYTGFNLHPIHSFGTIEFRHLSGTDDVEKISKWVSLILALKNAALIYKLEDLFKVIADLNTNSEYYIFASNIFKESLQDVNHNLQELMEKDISHIKECFFPPSKKGVSKEDFEKSAFFKLHNVNKKVKSQYHTLSLRELEVRLKELHTRYYHSFDPKEKESIAIEYREVDLLIKRLKKDIMSKTLNLINEEN